MRKEKKLAAALLATGLLASTATSAFAQICTPAQLCGDVNAEDGVTVVDALGVLRRAIELPVDLTCTCTGGEELFPGGAQETGQTQCWDPIDVTPPINPINCEGTGQDGEFKWGVPNVFVNNGDGTISDQHTKLMWEVLTDDGDPLHDYDDASYQWAGAFGKIQDLNAAAFAGYDDWRLPTVKELETLVNFQNYNPATFAAFNVDCVAGCTATECSCTRPSLYWTSTTYLQSSSLGWAVQFQTGLVSNSSKVTYNYVRAVRDGY